MPKNEKFEKIGSLLPGKTKLESHTFNAVYSQNQEGEWKLKSALLLTTKSLSLLNFVRTNPIAKADALHSRKVMSEILIKGEGQQETQSKAH